jgi:hypothetical protein
VATPNCGSPETVRSYALFERPLVAVGRRADSSRVRAWVRPDVARGPSRPTEHMRMKALVHEGSAAGEMFSIEGGLSDQLWRSPPLCYVPSFFRTARTIAPPTAPAAAVGRAPRS